MCRTGTQKYGPWDGPEPACPVFRKKNAERLKLCEGRGFERGPGAGPCTGPGRETGLPAAVLTGRPVFRRKTPALLVALRGPGFLRAGPGAAMCRTGTQKYGSWDGRGRGVLKKHLTARSWARILEPNQERCGFRCAVRTISLHIAFMAIPITRGWPCLSWRFKTVSNAVLRAGSGVRCRPFLFVYGKEGILL